MTQWWAVYEVGSGRLVSQGTVIADPLPDGLAKVEIVEQNPEGKAWNEKTLDFDIDVAPPIDVRAELALLVARVEAASTVEEAKVAAAEVKGKLDPADVVDVLVVDPRGIL